MAERVAFKDCYAKWDGTRLTVGNARMVRVWRVESGALFAESLRVGDVEWLQPAGDVPGWTPAVALPEELRTLAFSAGEWRESPVSEPSLRVVLRAGGASMSLVYAFWMYPHSAAVTGQLCVEGEGIGQVVVAQESGEAAPTGVELLDAKRRAPEIPKADLMDAFSLNPQHVRLTQVRLMDRTDVHNELVFENEWLLLVNENNLQLQGNVFVMEDVLGKRGLILLKQGPLPHARPVGCAVDALVHGNNRTFRFYGHGMGQGMGEGYAQTVMAYEGGDSGRQEVMQAFQRLVRPFDAKRDGRFLSNTWGDRSRDARIQEGFMLKEVAAGKRLGVDVIQIDDGWETGTTSNSMHAQTAGGVWEGYWAANPDFWKPHAERFPNGLEPVIAAARKEGLQFGLWFGPDSAEDFKHWEKDAETILDFHRQLGVNYIKIDGVKARTKVSEKNLRRFFDRVLAESQGRVVFDLDVTAEIRPGYFGMMHVGPLFVENRYTDFHRYFPHQTLRNVWKLSRWVDPMRLRMEFLNNTRNVEKYGDDPLAPRAYRADYLFATVMVTNPLGWFEVSNLPEDYVADVSKLVAVWKTHRAALAGGRIHPIGQAPDGTSWTGFASVGADRRSGYVLVFRELNERADCRMDVPMFGPGKFEVEALAGEGAVFLEDGVLAARIDTPQRFLFAKVYKTVKGEK